MWLSATIMQDNRVNKGGCVTTHSLGVSLLRGFYFARINGFAVVRFINTH